MTTLLPQVTTPFPAQAVRPPVAPLRADRPLMRVFVRDLIVQALVGIYDHEKTTPQRLRINLDLQVLDRAGPKADEIYDVVSYEEALNLVVDMVAQGHVNLLETLAERIAAALLRDRRVHSATIRLEKLDAFRECAAVGVEITRDR